MKSWIFIDDQVTWHRVKMLSLVIGLAIASVAAPMPLRPYDHTIIYSEELE